MRPLLLCRERLYRLLAVLDRRGGECSIRDLVRTYGIRESPRHGSGLVIHIVDLMRVKDHPSRHVVNLAVGEW